MFGGILIAVVAPRWVVAQTGPVIVVDPGDGQNGMTMALQCDGKSDVEFTDHGTKTSAPYLSSRWFKPEGAREMVLHREGKDPERIWKVETTYFDPVTKKAMVLVIQHDLPDFVPVWKVDDRWVSSHGDELTWYRGVVFGSCLATKCRINDTEDLDLLKDKPTIEIHYNPRPADTCQ
jgi:hypothetical protein